ncbi:helix-turn-helix transcriptional regulator [Hyphomonas sp. GM-8P]|uniref:helix-turn-helix transcriptional regulator n=1 Tax=Hyphomonas sp. GM-8P TaxID=1280945 RepID=UPI000DBFE306|nr:helix-turn-helix transcriptional regulator [Hyphomonas sp. GM-8P]RAN39994.1 hypothetical protein HY26_13855 [Hyphomonas sp. GM-8P]
MNSTSRSDTGSGEMTSDLHEMAVELVSAGKRAGLPYMAAAADVSDPSPISDSDGRPYAETLFKWFDPDLDYWNDRTFALRSGFIHASRICSEPMYFDGKSLNSWRPNRALEVFNNNAEYEFFGVTNAIVCPCYMPFGVIGAITWVTNEDISGIKSIFMEHAPSLHLKTLKFLSAYREIVSHTRLTEVVDLTRREVQCLKWAALGKTDNEISKIVGVSVPTVRFHLTNAGRKLGVSGRAQAVRIATNMGYIGRGAQ